MAGGVLTVAAFALAAHSFGPASAPKANDYAAISHDSNPAPVTAYSDKEADFVVGKVLYLRSTKTRIGTIESADESHAFPPTFRHPRMKAVLMRRKDGPRDWIPVDGITRLYVVNK